MMNISKHKGLNYVEYSYVPYFVAIPIVAMMPLSKFLISEETEVINSH